MIKVSQFIKEAVQFRINSLLGPLTVMRNAFETNVAFDRPMIIMGALLSRMAQGTPIISIEIDLLSSA